MRDRFFTLAATLLLTSCWVQAQRGEIHVYTGEGGFLGVNVREVRSEDVTTLGLAREMGVYVEAVQEDSPADRAGLKAGDVILKYEDRALLGVRHFQRLISETPAGRQVSLEIFRDRQTLTLSAQVGERPDRRILARAPRPGVPFFDAEERELIIRPREAVRAFSIFSDRPRLGISGGELTEQMAQFLGVPQKKGVLVMEVVEGTPAHRAELRAGDAIVAVDGKPVGSLSELSRQLTGDSHELEIVRDKQSLRVPIQFERPSPREREGATRL